jgi:ATP synthase protein I
MTETEPGQEPIGEDSRIASLEERLRRAEEADAVRTGRTGAGGADENYRLGNRVLGELIGAPVGGALIGWVLDRFLGPVFGWQRPWLLLAFLLLGFVVGFRNIIRMSTKRPKQ